MAAGDLASLVAAEWNAAAWGTVYADFLALFEPLADALAAGLALPLILPLPHLPRPLVCC